MGRFAVPIRLIGGCTSSGLELGMDNIEKARWADDAFDVLVTHELAEMKGYANSAFVESMLQFDMGAADGYMEIPVLAPNGTWVKVLAPRFEVRPDGTRGILWRLHAQSSSLAARIPDAQADLFEVQRRYEDALIGGSQQ